jgi:hypothetical protein
MNTGICARSVLPGVPSVPEVRRGDAPVSSQKAASSEALLARRLHQQASQRIHVRVAQGWRA